MVDPDHLLILYSRRMVVPILFTTPLISADSISVSHLQKVECLCFSKDGEYFKAQFAIDGVLAPRVECHASIPAERRWTDTQLMAYLIRSSETMIDLFGDARLSRSECPALDGIQGAA